MYPSGRGPNTRAAINNEIIYRPQIDPMFKERKAKRKRFIVGQLREKVNLTSGLATAQSTHAGECTDRAADQTEPITSNYRNSLWWDFDWVGCGENQLKCFNFQRFSRTISRSRFSCVKFRLISETSFLTWLNNERSPIVAHDVSTRERNFSTMTSVAMECKNLLLSTAKKLIRWLLTLVSKREYLLIFA